MIVFQNTVKLSEGRRLLLVPIGDIHYNVKDCDKPRFHRLIAWLLEREEAGDVVRIVGLGDYTDHCLRASARHLPA